jgi:hypothetical protein
MAAPADPSREYRPALSSRKNELTGWFLVLLTGGAWWVISTRSSSLSLFIPLFFLLFLFLAAFTSLANWIERRTLLRISPSGVHFQNGLRDVSLAWSEINEVHILPSRWGQAVHILGENRHFHFQLAGEVTVMGKPQQRVGFLEGQQILSELLSNTQLQKVERNRPGRFYARGKQDMLDSG